MKLQVVSAAVAVVVAVVLADVVALAVPVVANVPLAMEEPESVAVAAGIDVDVVPIMDAGWVDVDVAQSAVTTMTVVNRSFIGRL